MQSILVPCDFSKLSIYGLHFAVELAQATGATITVMSVVDQQQHEDDPLLSERLREAFENVVIKIPQPVQIIHRIRFDKLAQAIYQVLAECHIDQIVVGTRGSMTTHGAPDLNHLYGTSIAADVINHAHLPTWTCVQYAVSDHAGI